MSSSWEWCEAPRRESIRFLFFLITNSKVSPDIVAHVEPASHFLESTIYIGCVFLGVWRDIGLIKRSYYL